MKCSRLGGARSARSFAFSVTSTVATAAALALPGCAGDPPPAPKDPTPGAVHFVTMSYNINQPNVAGATLDAIGAPNAEIVCLQEVDETWKGLIQKRYAAQYANMVFEPNDTMGGLAVLSHYPLEDRGVIALPGNPGQWHPGLIVRVQTPGGWIEVVDVHLRAIFEGDSNPITNYLDRGIAHVQEMKVFLGRADETVPIVVAGDFNEGPTGASVRALEDRGFVNVLPLYRPGQYTWRHASVGGTADSTEDYVLFDRTFEPLNAWVSRSGASDHLPVLGHVQMRTTTSPSAAPAHGSAAAQN